MSADEVDPPEPVKWIQWIWKHLTQEGDVIRRAPLAFVLIVVAALWAGNWIAAQRFNSTIDGLKAKIDTKDAEIEFIDKRLQASEAKSTGGAASRSLVKLVAMTRAQNTKDGKYAWTLFVQNIGNGAASGLLHQMDQKITNRRLSSAELDQWFSELKEKLVSSRASPPTIEIQAGDSEGTSNASDIDGAAFDREVNSGAKLIYTVAVIEYRDDDTPPGKWRITEICGFATGGNLTANCESHNRIYLSD